jgi:hypothetical protein
MNRMVSRFAAFVVVLAFGSVARAQESRYIVSGSNSLAWWQVSEPRAHLWGTSCPEDPTWQGGEGASKTSVTRQFDIADSAYAQHLLRGPGSRCGEALQGSIALSDPVAWRNVRGTIVLASRALVSGSSIRDGYARKVVLEVDKYPSIRFTIDSLTGIEEGEPVRATAVGTFELRGRTEAMRVPVIVQRQSNGLRVRARFEIPVAQLIEQFGVSRTALGPGADRGVWNGIRVGVDVVLTQSPAAVAASSATSP